jgi:hypothetical protein
LYSRFIPNSFVSTNGFNNGITTLSLDFIRGPGDSIHYNSGKPTPITVCNKNLCTGLTTCKVFNVYPPAPCYDDCSESMHKLSIVSKIILKSTLETETSKIIIFPNPTNGNLKITLSETLSETYQFFDQTTSQLIQENKFDNKTELQIELSPKLKSEIYILKLNSENNSFTEKIILNK